MNPRDDPHRLASVVYFPLAIRHRAIRQWISEMCDRPSEAPVSLAENARIFKNVYGVVDGDVGVRLVDEWDRGLARVAEPPLAVVYCTARQLLSWGNEVAIRGDLIQRGSLELHEHVKRMDAYLKERLSVRSELETALKGDW